jgi:hypothetical protein
MRPGMALVQASVLAACGACRSEQKVAPAEGPPASATSGVTQEGRASAQPASAPPPEPPRGPEAPDPSRYGWLTDDSRPFPEPVETLHSRFAAPGGYQRVELSEGTFGRWLRHLPVAAKGTPVVDREGQVVTAGDDRYVAGVVAIDVGKKDLQHGPDVIVRLHGEWMWSKGEFDGIAYRSVTRLDMPFSRWIRGERVTAKGGSLAWAPIARPLETPSHTEFRDFLDMVFNWVNSRSLHGDAKAVDPAEVRPGDFLVHEGKPGDAVIILDMARGASDRTLVMLGRAQSPAQSIHVVSPGAQIAWFEIGPPTPLLTPSTDEFDWGSLRRLD